MSREHYLFQLKHDLRELKPYEPGLSVEGLRRKIGSNKKIVKLGSNEGPWGPLPSAAEAISKAINGLNRYPDGAFFKLRSLIAQQVGVDKEQIVLGNGADSILINLTLSLLERGDEVIFGWPSFITYPLSVRKVGASPIAIPLDTNYKYDLDAMLGAITDRTRIIMVCNPNNPTGTYVDKKALEAFIDSVPEHILCVIDEAYSEYVTNDDYPNSINDLIVRDDRPNILVLHTMSKIYGLAGLRIGWGVGPKEVVRGIDTVRGPFEMNALANEAAISSFNSQSELKERIELNIKGRADLFNSLNELDFNPLQGAANFICVPLDKDISGKSIAEKLHQEGVIVRPLDMFGMPNGFRITVGTPKENQIAIEAMAKQLSGL